VSDWTHRDLGMGRNISRRDSLNGVAMTVTSSVVAPPWLESMQGVGSPEQALDYYPPLRTGLRGSHPGSFEVAHQLRDAKPWRDAATDTGESYDLVVVGGRISGLASYNYNTLFDPVEWCLSSPEDRACVVGRRQCGRISIANADAAGSSHTDAAIDMAYRAVGEIVESRACDHLSHFKPSSH